jgi:adenylylsulfate kinase
MANHQSLSGELAGRFARPGFALWFTGLPAAGKTTLARAVQKLLGERDIHTILLDSDELRRVLTPQPVYTAAERDWFYGVVAYLAAWLAGNGVNVLIAATANRRTYRAAARAQIPRFGEVFVQCSPETCRRRDPKGLYAQVQSGEIAQLPGADASYEAPLDAEVTIDTETHTPAAAAELVLTQLAPLLA